MAGTSESARRRWANATEEQRRMMGRRTADDPEEFWRRVNKNGPRHPKLKTRCWLWTGGTRGGYGRFRIKGKFFSAHVRSLEMANGPLSHGKKALHHCDNPTCVRPEHLFEGTQHENILDSAKKGRHKNPVHRGESNPNAKVSEKDVTLLRSNPPSSAEKPIVARRLGITVHSLNRILRGERWKEGT
jgi:hypothetical protein